MKVTTICCHLVSTPGPDINETDPPSHGSTVKVGFNFQNTSFQLQQKASTGFTCAQIRNGKKYVENQNNGQNLVSKNPECNNNNKKNLLIIFTLIKH